MKVALITDTHFGARNDNQVIQEHINQFFGEVFFPYLDEHNIKTVIHLGDLMDKRKTVSYLTLNNLQNNFMNRLHDSSIETHILVGNHDSYYKNTLKLNSVAELYGKSSLIHVYETAKTISIDGLSIFLLPWLCPDNSILKREYAELFFEIGEAEVPVCMTSTITSLYDLAILNALL